MKTKLLKKLRKKANKCITYHILTNRFGDVTKYIVKFTYRYPLIETEIFYEMKDALEYRKQSINSFISSLAHLIRIGVLNKRNL